MKFFRSQLLQAKAINKLKLMSSESSPTHSFSTPPFTVCSSPPPPPSSFESISPNNKSEPSLNATDNTFTPEISTSLENFPILDMQKPSGEVREIDENHQFDTDFKEIKLDVNTEVKAEEKEPLEKPLTAPQENDKANNCVISGICGKCCLKHGSNCFKMAGCNVSTDKVPQAPSQLGSSSSSACRPPTK